MPLENDDIVAQCSQLVAPAAQMIAKSISAITFRERLGPLTPGKPRKNLETQKETFCLQLMPAVECPTEARPAGFLPAQEL